MPREGIADSSEIHVDVWPVISVCHDTVSTVHCC